MITVLELAKMPAYGVDSRGKVPAVKLTLHDQCAVGSEINLVATFVYHGHADVETGFVSYSKIYQPIVAHNTERGAKKAQSVDTQDRLALCLKNPREPPFETVLAEICACN